MASEHLSCELGESARESQRLEWANLASHALEVVDIPGGVRVEFHADMYEQVEDLVNRETQCCGSWLKLGLARKYDLLLLTATAEDEPGQSVIRSMVELDGC